jgi:starch synthase
MAVTCRDKPNSMHGGDQEFSQLISEAKRQGVKIIVDSLARISSSRAHRKYKDLMLHYLDQEGRKRICYGTDGLAMHYEDTAMLNYRKLESWELLIEEVVNFATKYEIDGIQLDNGQAWPQILEADLDELTRTDPDGEPAYSPLDVLNGEMVLKNENHGYWNTNTMENYPNPFFIKMAKTLWEKFPNFVLMAECWGGYMFENRQVILSRSGLVPRLYKLPQAIGSLFGKKLYRDGRVVPCDKENVEAIKKWHESNRKFMPEGAIQLQSSSAHVWPYPAYVYGRGTWAAADILFFMFDIPVTFMGEIEGEVYRIGQTGLF